MCVTDRHDMTLAVRVALNSNTTNQLLVKGTAYLIVRPIARPLPDIPNLGPSNSAANKDMM